MSFFDFNRLPTEIRHEILHLILTSENPRANFVEIPPQHARLTGDLPSRSAATANTDADIVRRILWHGPYGNSLSYFRDIDIIVIAFVDTGVRSLLDPEHPLRPDGLRRVHHLLTTSLEFEDVYLPGDYLNKASTNSREKSLNFAKWVAVQGAAPIATLPSRLPVVPQLRTQLFSWRNLGRDLFLAGSYSVPFSLDIDSLPDLDRTPVDPMGWRKLPRWYGFRYYASTGRVTAARLSWRTVAPAMTVIRYRNFPTLPIHDSMTRFRQVEGEQSLFRVQIIHNADPDFSDSDQWLELRGPDDDNSPDMVKLRFLWRFAANTTRYTVGLPVLQVVEEPSQ